MDSQSTDIHSSQFKVVECIEGEEYFDKFIKEASQLNNIKLEEKIDVEEEESVTITFRKGGVLDKNSKEGKIKDGPKAEIKVNLELKSKHLTQMELLRIIKFLQRREMCLQEYLNSGGEADVYRGQVIDGNGNSVERVFRIIKASKDEQILEIREEYQRMTAIQNSQNLISYQSFIELKGIFIFIMDYYPCSLKDKLATNVSILEFWRIVFDLFDGLVELRVHNIIHSDIKPANILMKSNGTCIISDFGMSLKLKNRQQISDDKKGYSLKYCSPEHQNGKTLSYASDMYSVGILVLELSSKLQDEEEKKIIEEFVKDHMIQEDPEKRIKPENLIPKFLLTVEPIIYVECLNQYLLKIKNNKFAMNEEDLTVNKFAHQKVFQSYLLLQVIYIYLVNEKKDLITFKSIEDVEFQFFSYQYLPDLFLAIAKMPGNQLTSEERIRYLQSAILVLNSQPTSDCNIKLMIDCEDQIGNNLSKQGIFSEQKYQESIDHYQVALTLLLNHFPTELIFISSIYENIGQNYTCLNNKEEGIKCSHKSIEYFQSFQAQQQQLISKWHNLALQYQLQKDKQNALQQYQKIVDVWNQNQKLKSNKLSQEDYPILQKIVTSLHELGQYTRSYEMEIQRLRYINKNLENLEEIRTALVARNMNMFTQDEITNALKNILSDKNNDLIKKMILYEFMSYFEKKGDFEQIFKILEVFDTIKEEMQLNQQAKLKLILASYYRKMNQQNEVRKYLKEGVELMDKPNLTSYLLNTELDIFCQLIEDDNLKDLALKCFKQVEEKSQVANYFHPIERQILLKKINTLKETYGQKIN